MTSVQNVTYEQMLARNVSIKEKREYVNIWKALMDKYKKKTT